MFEYETYTTRTPLAPAVTRNHVLSTLRSAEIFSPAISPNRNDAVRITAADAEPILANATLLSSSTAAALRTRGAWWHLTDRDGGASPAADRVVYSCFLEHTGDQEDEQEAEGLTLFCAIPLGLECCLRYRIDEGGDMRQGRWLVLRQEVKIRSHSMFMAYCKESIEMQRRNLGRRMSEKAQLAEYAADMDALFDQ